MLSLDNGFYGDFGGQFVPELLIEPLQQLEEAFQDFQQNSVLLENFEAECRHYMGRPSPLTGCSQLAQALKGPRVLLKREDLLHSGAHKINNALGQCLLAKKMGKKRIIAETGAGQHGVATATACARLQLKCEVYMGQQDMTRQAVNVQRMRCLGATVHAVNEGAQTLNAAVNAALRDWSERFHDSHYCLGSALGPHPFPSLVAFFQKVIGEEARRQCLEQYDQLPDVAIACVGGGSNAIGLFQAFINDPTQLIGVEAGGQGIKSGQHAARMIKSNPGILHGCYSYLLQDKSGNVLPTHSISAGLDYPMIGPQHAYLDTIKRASYVTISDEQAKKAFYLLARTEGIIPALETAHAIAYYCQESHQFSKNSLILINCSGRGDKDLATMAEFS